MRKLFLLATAVLMMNVRTNAETIVVLDDLTASYQAHNGDVLTGRLQKNIQITVAHKAKITLRNVTIFGANSRAYEWAGIDCQGDATIILEGASSVYGFYEVYPGITVPKDYTLTIEGNGTLIAASQGRAAGIGSSWSGLENLGDGYVKAYDGYCGKIIINGGTIYAYGGKEAAGIGNSYDSRCQSVIITSNVNKVYAEGGTNASYAIGGGWWCGEVKVGGVTYKNGVVGDANHKFTYTPWTGNLSQLTGDAEIKDGSTITGTLTQLCKITIPDGAHIKLKGATINSAGTVWDDSWAGLNCNGDATIEVIGDETSSITGFGKGYPAIHVPAGKTLHLIGDGSLMAYGAEWGAGIGGGSAVACGNIHIGGNINLYAIAGCDYAAAIGGGYNKGNGTITIDNTVKRVKAEACSSSACTVGAGWGAPSGERGNLYIGGRTYYGCLDENPYVYVGTNQGVEDVQKDKVQGTKVLRDGQLYLMYEGKMYDVQGKAIKN